MFLEQAGFNKVFSLGGWSFSTKLATYSIFCDAVAPSNQDTFVANIVSFVTEYDLDGIDIDWECKFAASGLSLSTVQCC